jgi:hypothetical protein
MLFIQVVMQLIYMHYITTAFQDEFHGIMNTIEITYEKDWRRLWLENNSHLI